jgi:hypothetical protein
VKRCGRDCWALTGGITTWLVLAGGTIYVLLAGWMMAATPYDTWGVAVALPFIVAIGAAVAHHTFRRPLQHLRRAAMVGLAAKLAGTLARYWVANEAYGGSADSNIYHDAGRLIAGNFHDGYVSITGLIPHTRGTLFIHELTGFLYAFAGSSKLAGFMWFALMGYVGVVLCVKAATVAIPGLNTVRYAWLCFLAPSLVFWPSSIGKEAVISRRSAQWARAALPWWPRYAVAWITPGGAECHDPTHGGDLAGRWFSPSCQVGIRRTATDARRRFRMVVGFAALRDAGGGWPSGVGYLAPSTETRPITGCRTCCRWRRPYRARGAFLPSWSAAHSTAGHLARSRPLRRISSPPFCRRWR